MFTFAALLLLWYASRQSDKANSQDVKGFSDLYDKQETQALLHIRQDLRLVYFVLWGILLMLGFIGDVLLIKL
jgi:hypothetical protein